MTARADILPAAMLHGKKHEKRDTSAQAEAHEGLANRSRAGELEKAWWSEEAELSSGPAAAGKNSLPEDETASTKWQVLHMHYLPMSKPPQLCISLLWFKCAVHVITP